MLSKILTGAAAVAATVMIAAGPALADPPAGTTPKTGDVVGVGSDTTQFLLDQLSHDYNGAHGGAKLYSWDAVPQGQTITVKQGGVSKDCTIVRPTGSGAGKAALEANATVSGGTGFCIDYSRSSAGRATGDPACASKGGICFVSLGGDAVTWAARAAGTDAPASLTQQQLKSIYLCKIRNWSQVGGKSAPIKAYLPQSSSGTGAFFLTALGGGTTAITPGTCVSDVHDTLIENEGDAPQLNNAEAIFPYSVADYLAQSLHSASCSKASCGYPSAPACTPRGSQNLFGCDLTGALALHEISNKPPTTSGRINSSFPSLFQRTVYDIVRSSDGATADNIPAYLESFFAASSSAHPGWICTAGKAHTDILDYGFLPLRPGPNACGTTH